MTEREALVMSELVRGERYGLELVERSHGVLKRSGIYVLLGRMQDKGWIESREERAPSGESGPARRVYRPTNLGRAHLSAHGVVARALGRIASPGGKPLKTAPRSRRIPRR